jgi:hypothetical protein
MAADELPDFDALALELVQLQHREQDLLRQYDKALERIAAFPNEVEHARAAGIGAALDEIGGRIESLEAQLLPVRRHDE